MPLIAVRAQVAAAIQLVVCCERLQDGSRKLTHIAEVLPLDERGDYRTQDLFVSCDRSTPRRLERQVSKVVWGGYIFSKSLYKRSPSKILIETAHT